MSPLTLIAVLAALIFATCHAATQSLEQDDRQTLRIALHSSGIDDERQEDVRPTSTGLKNMAANSHYRLKRSPAAGGGGKTSKQQPDRRGCHIGVRATPSMPFMASVQIGTPPQAFEALLDTGTPISWMLHSRCLVNDAPWVPVPDAEGETQAAQRAKFAHDQSSSYKRERGRVELKYAQDIDLRGVWVNETVRFADALVDSRSLVVRQQPMAMITHLRGPEKKFDYESFPSAVIGLGFPAQALSGDRNTLFESLLLGEQVREPVFSVYFRANQDDGEQRGELILGQIDRSLYTGEITWTEVTETPAWQVRLGSIRAGEATTVCAHGCQAILSTGTSVIVGPGDEVAQLNEQLGFAPTRADRRMFAAPGLCADHPGRNKSLVFEIENTRFEVGADKLMMDFVTNKGKGKERCVSVLRALDLGRAGVPGQKWILGAPFISSFYTIFNYGELKVGLAQPTRPRTLRS